MFNLNSDDKEKIIVFLTNNYAKFPKNVRDFFDKCFSVDEIYQIDIMAEIYAYLFPQKYIADYNFYTCYISYLFNKFPDLKNRKILEVASGLIPGVALLINEITKADNISCIDPRTINLPIKGVNQIKKRFTLETDISDYDLLIAHCPCDAFAVMVDKVLEDPHDLCVQTCRCYQDEYLNRIRFKKYLIRQINKLERLEKYGYFVDASYTQLMRKEAPVITLKREKCY